MPSLVLSLSHGLIFPFLLFCSPSFLSFGFVTSWARLGLLDFLGSAFCLSCKAQTAWVLWLYSWLFPCWARRVKVDPNIFLFACVTTNYQLFIHMINDFISCLEHMHYLISFSKLCQIYKTKLETMVTSGCTMCVWSMLMYTFIFSLLLSLKACQLDSFWCSLLLFMELVTTIQLICDAHYYF